MAPNKVAIITGGAKGMGMYTAEALVARGGWSVHLLDNDATTGQETAARLAPHATFHQIDLRDYDAIGALFRSIFESSGRRIDFVHSNAGVLDPENYYTTARTAKDPDAPPPRPNFFSIDVNLVASLNVCHIGRHYLNLSPEKGSIVVTASCASVYAVPFSPVYTASKYGILGYVRSVAPTFSQEGIRINALCPGQVRTTLVSDWSGVPPAGFTPPSIISSTVLSLLDGADLTDSKGVTVRAGDLFGQAVIANGPNFYFSNEPEYVDQNMAELVAVCKPEFQVGRMIHDRK